MKWIPPIAMFVVLAGCSTKIEEHHSGDTIDEHYTEEREKEYVGPRVGHEAHEGDHRAIKVEVDHRREGSGDRSRQGERSKTSSTETSAPAEPEKKSVEKTPDVKKPDVKEPEEKKPEEKTSDAKKPDEKKPQP